MKLAKGEKMTDFTYLSPYKEGEFHLNDFLNGKKTYVVFLRYYGCTACRVDMHHFTQRFKDFEEKLCNLMVVLQSDPAVVRDEAEIGTFPFELACDPEQNVYRQFEIEPAKSMVKLAGAGVFKLLSKGSEAKKLGFEHGKYEGNEQQLPALVLIDENGVIEYAHYAKHLTDMPSVDEMLSKI